MRGIDIWDLICDIIKYGALLLLIYLPLLYVFLYLLAEGWFWILSNIGIIP